MKAIYAATCPYFGCVVTVASPEVDALPEEESAPVMTDAFPTEMSPVLEGEQTERSYPVYPHSPLLVAAAACDAVMLRWRSFEELLWPVERFVLQRYPDPKDQPQWSTILDANALELLDLDVQPGRRYAYRLQAFCKGNVSSAYAYHWTRVEEARTDGSAALLGVNSDGLRSLGLIFACFLTVYGLMRASVMGVQGTQSRSYRLKRIKKSTSEGVAPVVAVAPTVSMVPRRSSTSTSSSSPSVGVEQQSTRSSMFDSNQISTTATAGGLTRAHSSADTSGLMRQESFPTPIPDTFRPMSRSIGAIAEKAEVCHHCRKRFGLFRRRYLCDICHSVTLCRKCGYQASVDSFSNARASVPDNLGGGSIAANGSAGSIGRRRASISQQQQKKLKIRTICRSCCDDMYRYSTHPSVRPSYVPAANHSNSGAATAV
ncbi:hypothetical protein BBJ28_00004622 [Nothophytophthora sp. Chile5]|nr:hypothetical protein BBJ28_00004622 [Nothophytophthora sp. Chile5]